MEKQVIQLLEFKIQIPNKCKFSLERTDLLKKMFVTDANIFLLHGKAGYGKTELAKQYTKRNGAIAAWYNLDKSDNNIWRFLTYLDFLFSRMWKDYERVTPTSDIQLFFLNILYDANEQLKKGAEKYFVLILDSFEVIENEGIIKLIQKMAKNLPINFKFFFTTKGCVPDFISRFVMNGTCMILDEEELAFTEREQYELAKMILSCEEAEKEVIVRKCKELLEGWPAGTILALLCIEKRKVDSNSINWSYIFQDSMINSFLSCEIFRPLPKEESDFLIRTSRILELKDKICDKVLQIDNSRMIIQKLLKKNLLIYKDGGGEIKICHHKLIRFFLREREDYATQEEIAKRAANYYLEEKNYAQAAAQAVEIGYTSIIIKVLELYGDEMLSEEKDKILKCCIQYLEDRNWIGDNLISGRNLSWMTQVLGIAAQYYYKVGRMDKAEIYLNQADSAFGKENKFAMYRGLYKGLLKYPDDPLKYEKQINHALFLLQENRFSLPYLNPREQKILKKFEAEQKHEESKKLKVTFFGDFQVEVMKEQKRLTWRTRKGSELFAYLIELSGRAVGRKQLLQKLWCDELPDNAVTMLHNMLYNIRKELSNYHLADLIQYKDKMYGIQIKEIESDVTEIRYLCELVDRGNIEELKTHKDRFQTYWGRYLEDIDSQWAMEQREYYDTRFLKGCTMLAEQAIASAQYQEASILFKNAMLINCYSEELAANLLECYGAMHNLKQAKTEYERFSSLLERDLDLKPGKRLTEIYKKVLNPQTA